LKPTKNAARLMDRKTDKQQRGQKTEGISKSTSKKSKRGRKMRLARGLQRYERAAALTKTRPNGVSWRGSKIEKLGEATRDGKRGLKKVAGPSCALAIFSPLVRSAEGCKYGKRDRRKTR